MKKTLLTISIMAGLMMTACVKESANEQMGLPEGAMMLTTEGFQGHNTKTSVSGTSVQWVGDGTEKVYLNGNEYTVGLTGGNAYVTASDADKTGETYGYTGLEGTPTWTSGTKTLSVTVPAEYTSSYSGGRQVIALPMVAYKDATADKIEFKHVTAAVKVVVKNSTANVLYLDSVMVSSDDFNLSGAITTDLDADGLGLSAASGNGTVKVKFTGDPSIAVGATKEVQVPILPINASDLTIKVYSHNANIAGVPVTGLTHNFSKSAASVALGRNIMITAQIDMKPVNSNVVSKGAFSVSDSKAIYFSQGNLKCSRINSENAWADNNIKWSFLDHQYDVVETGSVSENYQNETAIGLFGYGTSGIAYTGHATIYQPWKTDGTANNYYSSNLTVANESDWGSNTIYSGVTATNGWRTLSQTEWEYLLVSRTTTATGLTGTNASIAMFGLTKIGDNYMFVLYPDNYSHPSGVAQPSTKHNALTSSNANTITTTDADAMVAAGAVLFPYTGYRNGTTMNNYNSYGDYWSSTIKASTTANKFQIRTYSVNASTGYTGTISYGFPVRLVKDAN